MTRRLLFLLVLAISVTTIPARAQQPLNELALSAGRSDLQLLGDAAAVGISYNRYWKPAASTRFGIFAAGENLDAEFGEVIAGAAHVSFEYHFLHDRRISPYAGAGAALTVTHVSSLARDTKLAPIFSGGIDLRVTPRLTVGADARFLFYDIETNDRFIGSLTLKPATVLISAKFLY
jgi:hypothetical protein